MSTPRPQSWSNDCGRPSARGIGRWWVRSPRNSLITSNAKSTGFPVLFKYARQDLNLQAASRRRDPFGPRSATGSLSNTPGRTRTCNPRFRSLRRGDFATPEGITKSTVSRCRSMTSGSISSFAAFVSFTVQRREKGTDLRIPQIQPALAMRVSCMFFPPVGFF